MRLLAVVIMCGVLAVALAVVWGKLREARRADFIRTYAFPKGLIERLQRRRPGLPAEDGDRIGHRFGPPGLLIVAVNDPARAADRTLCQHQ